MTIVIVKIIIEVKKKWKKGKTDLMKMIVEINDVEDEEDVNIEVEEKDKNRMRSLAIGNEDILSTIIYRWMRKK